MKFLKIALLVGATSFFGTHLAMAKNPDCAAVEAALSAAEDTAASALTGDMAAFHKGSDDITTSLKLLKASLSEKGYATALSAQQQFSAASAKSDYPAAALSALDIYKTIVSEAGSVLPSGADVAMLDYAGFKIKALLKTHAWDAIAAEVTVADAHWQAIKPNLKDTATSEMVDEIHHALSKATKAQNADWLENTATLELASVDLIEHQVAKSTKMVCK